MKAVRFLGLNEVQIVDNMPIPVPQGDEVLIKIAAAGVCHSDLHVIDDGIVPGPFTLGHENAGYVEAMGESVKGFEKGDAVVVYGPWGCGHCKPCRQSSENYCDNHADQPAGGGLGLNGGMAEYMLVPSSRLLVHIHDLDPVMAAPITDAALTPYSAIKRSLPKLTPEQYVVVIGIGGLGHTALQILKAVTCATVIACDITTDKLDFAKKMGASYVINSTDADAAEQIVKITGVKKAIAVFDFVGATSTIALGAKVVSLNGDLTIIGLSGGAYPFGFGKVPFGVNVSIPYWGSEVELMEVIDLAKNGHIHIEVEKYRLDQALEVYDKMRKGELKGRAVLIP
ncbi:MAG: NAD(P)-dependent alcohol dehydrogenase [Flavobacterium sp.]